MPHETVIVVGSGPAGLTAALYTARANLKPLVVDGLRPGGPLTLTTEGENYPGVPEGVQGPELMDRMRAQVERFGTRFVLDEVAECDLSQRPFTLRSANGDTYTCDVLIIATGADAKYLGLTNEERLQKIGGGVSACATCDGFFYEGLEVAVIGGGDTAVEEATFLTRFATRVYIVHRRDALRASKAMQAKALANPKIEMVWNTQVVDVLGESRIRALKLKNTVTGEEWEKPIGGMFLGIGHQPNTAPFVKWIDHDELGYLVTQPGRTATNIDGVFACGDAADHYYRQAITAAGTGCAAAIEAERWLEERASAGAH